MRHIQQRLILALALTAVGAVGGAVVGNQFGKGTGKTALTALGAAAGALAGRQVDARLDAASEVAATDATVEGAPANGTVRITLQGRNNQGETCHEFQKTVTVGGKVVDGYGQTCRDGAGAWRIES